MSAEAMLARRTVLANRPRARPISTMAPSSLAQLRSTVFSCATVESL
jgi:hypothetical protein